MGFLAKFNLEGKTYNVISFRQGVHQSTDYTGKPEASPHAGIFTLTIESVNDDNLTAWAVAERMTKQGKLVFLKRDNPGTLYDYEFADAYCVEYEEIFHHNNTWPMTTTITVSAGVVKTRGQVYERPWKTSSLGGAAPAEMLLAEVEEKAIISSIKWIDSSTQKTIAESTYGKDVELQIKIISPTTSATKVTVTKADGSEFTTGKKELTYNVTTPTNGIVDINVSIDKSWLELKKAPIDKLIAVVEHDGSSKKSGSLEITPPPEILVSFRPNDSWAGEFGFDWIREGDTSLFNDNKFDDIVSKQYTNSSFTTLERNGNKYKGKFKKDPVLLKQLKDKYKPFEITWKKVTDASGNQVNYRHKTEWLSLKKGDKAKVKIRIDVNQKGDYLEFDDNSNFTFTPKKIDIKNKTGKKTLTDIITIDCKKEFTTDEEIIIKAFSNKVETGAIAGKLNVWANSATNHKQKKVVFVQIRTPEIIPTKGKNKASASSEKSRINRYLNQAYIKLHPDSKIVDIDVSGDADFSRFVNSGKIKTVGSAIPARPAVAATASTVAIPARPAIPAQSLVDYLKAKLALIDSNKYVSYFKAFYFAENGYHASGNLSGYSAAGADYVVVFKSANDQTAAHEFLHSFNLPHTFTNSEASANAQFTYEAKKTDNLLDYSHQPGNTNKRCSLYYWQWIQANNAIT